MYSIRYKLLGALLILLSIFVISLSFGILFLGLNINLGSFNISPLVMKIINFAIILVFFLYLAYMGYIMIISAKER